MPRKILSISEALANPIRRMIVTYLIKFRTLSIGELRGLLGITRSNLFNHVMILSRVGVVRMTKVKRRIYITINDEILVNKLFNP